MARVASTAWSSGASRHCRRTCSRSSTTSRSRHGEQVGTSSTWDSATPTSRPRTSPCASSPRRRPSRRTIATRCRAACPSSARRSPATTAHVGGGARRRDGDHQHDRLEGGLQPPDVGVARPWRRGDRAQPELPDHIYGPLFAGADLRQVPMRSLAHPDERGSFAEEFFDRPRRPTTSAGRNPGARHLLPAQPHRCLRRARLHAACGRLLSQSAR